MSSIDLWGFAFSTKSEDLSTKHEATKTLEHEIQIIP